jgi:hypothetical protein
MSAALTQLPFHPDMEFVATREFTNGGYAYRHGSWIPKGPEHEAQYSTHERQLRILYENRYIEAVKPEMIECTPPRRAGEPDPAATAPVQPDADDDSHLPLRLKHRGFGRYSVVDAGNNEVAGPYSSKGGAKEARDNLLKIAAADARDPARSS